MSKRDERLAAQYRAKGKKSASETAREKEARRGSSTSVASGTEEALHNFDPSRPKETAIPRSEESKSRARSHKWGLPRLG